jgi:hypothetical protein
MLYKESLDTYYAGHSLKRCVDRHIFILYKNTTGNTTAMLKKYFAVHLIISLFVMSFISVPADALTKKLLTKPAQTRVQIGFVKGTVSIGPLCPHEPCDKSMRDIYKQHTVGLFKDGELVKEYRINRNGSFFGTAPAGKYQLDLIPNPWNVTCREKICLMVMPRIGWANVPADIEINARKITAFDIKVDTGIRYPDPMPIILPDPIIYPDPIKITIEPIENTEPVKFTLP